MKRNLAAILACMCLALTLGRAFAEELQLPGKKARDMEALIQTIASATDVGRVVFDETPVTPAALDQLREAFPELAFEYSLSVVGKKVRATATRVNLHPNKVTKEKEFRQLYNCLRWLPDVEELTAWDTAFTFEQLEELSALMPKMHVSCKIKIASHLLRTDATAFSTRHSYGSIRHTAEDFRGVKYCDNLLALDVGHNNVRNLDFLYDAPNLRVLILADNQVEDLSPVASLKELEYLEIFKNPVSDLSPLKGLTKLIDLNMTFCRVADYSPLLGLTKLDRLWISENPYTEEQLQMLAKAHPECTMNTTAGEIAPTAEGWRQGHPRYLQIVRIFKRTRYEEFKTP